MIRSRPHRAVLALLRAGLDLDPGPQAREDISTTPPEQIFAIASSHGILQMLAPAVEAGSTLADTLEPDARLFAREIRAANAKRNTLMLETLRAVSDRFARAGIEAVILKGGATLLAPPFDALEERFMGDLDLLIAPDRLDEANQILMAAGWQQTAMADFMQAEHHHLPALVHENAPGAIELHRRLGHPQLEEILTAGDMIMRSIPTEIDGLRQPSAADWLTHLIGHAQLSNYGWADRFVRLRDAVDLMRFTQREPLQAMQESRQRFVAVGKGEIFDGLAIATDMLLTLSKVPKANDNRSAQWAHTAARRIGEPTALRRAYLGRRLTWYLGALATNRRIRSHMSQQFWRRGSIIEFIRRLQTSLKIIR